MGQALPTDDQALHRAKLRRSGALRNGMVLGWWRLSLRSAQDRLSAWLRRPPASKEAASRPRSSAG